MEYSLVKMSASGNKFLIAGFPETSVPKKNPSCLLKTKKQYPDFLNLTNFTLKDRKDFLKSLQNKDMEGLAVLKKSSLYAFECEFYNRDGSPAEMCGNLSCCLTLYALETGLAKEETFNFMVGKEKVTAFKHLGKYWAGITKPAPVKSGFSIQFQETVIPYHFICPGVPHGVVEWKQDLNPSLLLPLALELRHKNPVQENAGLNVTFFSIQKEHSLKAITFERGVENWTKACGTGALAAALVYSQIHSFSNQNIISVEMPGGVLEILTDPSLALFSRPQWSYTEPV
ncbi:MAG: hypothetical protein OXB86_01365 [Bdellovibrionales bacterium]|nr:hypothetical protein [Bdellovibrionales bacterium]